MSPESPENLADLALLESYRQGDLAALSDLLVGYQDRLFAICMRMIGDHETARDLTQDALLRVIQGLDKFDGRSKLSTWIIRVTMNVCLTHLRRQRLRNHASLDAPMGSDSDGRALTRVSILADETEPGAPGAVEHTESLERLSRGMASLEASQRAILILRDLQGLDYQVIADILEVPKGTVKSRLFRARLALREAVQAQDPA
jgi:RNA polymerase sigma-70 factor (ECF subfamily)